MSVLDDATIIYVPGVYKTSAVALQKPISAGSVSSLTFARASTGTRVNSAGLIESVATNVPRVDYLNGSCGAQLLEPARTNLLTYSEQFDNVIWSKIGTGAAAAPIVTANAGVAPDGTLTAERVQFNAGVTAGNSSIIRQLVSATPGAVRHSFYVKSFDGSTQYINGHDGGTDQEFTVGSEWVRIDFNSATATIFSGLEVKSGTTTNNTADLLVWGAQLEIGSYATSYIPTVASTVTRSAETLSKTGLASLLGDSEGTIYFEGSFVDQSQDFISISDGTASNRVFLDIVTGQFRGRVDVGGVTQAQITGLSPSLNTSYKIAFRYAGNNFALYVDGVQVGTDITGSTFSAGTLTDLRFDNGAGSAGQFYGNVKALAVWDRALTDTELEDLTT